MKYTTLHLTEAAFNLIKAKHARPGIALTLDDGILHLMPNMKFVDLGLPSGILWAAYNVGANPGSTPESYYGDYYAWGETETKSNYSWDTYKFGSSSPFSKYDTDGKTALESIDNVANAIYGYYMPAKTELEKLNTLPYKWVTGFKGITGLNGYIFAKTQSELDGIFNDDTMLFIPAAGYFDGTSLNKTGSHGTLWSSSLYSDSHDSAWAINFNLSDIEPGIVHASRYYGFPVRAIKKP